VSRRTVVTGAVGLGVAIALILSAADPTGRVLAWAAIAGVIGALMLADWWYGRGRT
jgi:membrane associated rhomboid family serine protease